MSDQQNKDPNEIEDHVSQKLAADGTAPLPEGAAERLLAAVLAKQSADFPAVAAVAEPAPQEQPTRSREWSYNLAAVASLMAVFALGLLVTNYTPGNISIGPSTGTTEVESESAEGSVVNEGPSGQGQGDTVDLLNPTSSGSDSGSSHGDSNPTGGSTNEQNDVGDEGGQTDFSWEFAPGLLREPSTITSDSGGAGEDGTSGSTGDTDSGPPGEDIPTNENPAEDSPPVVEP